MGLFLVEAPSALHRLCHLRRHDHGTAFEPATGCHLLEVALQQVTRVRGVAVRDLPFLDLRLQRAAGTETEGGNGLSARAGTKGTVTHWGAMRPGGDHIQNQKFIMNYSR
jgi:hypothetical protein